jgi:molybdopterin molybdotransferase
VAALLSVSEARQQLISAFHPGEPVTVTLDAAFGRVLSKDIHSAVDWPPFASSSMDGFAVRWADVEQATPDTPVRLPVVADIPAGALSTIPLAQGTAVRIMTGAPIPAGADLVIPIEDTNHDRPHPGESIPSDVIIFHSSPNGVNVRPVGQDLHIGQSILPAGHRLRPQDVGMLATLGLHQVPVYPCPRVAILSTGDELVPPDQPLQPGQIHDSNSYVIAALVRQAGGEPVVLGSARDRFDVIQAKLDQAVAAKVDLILTSAGVSVGTYDFVREVVETHGKIGFWRVNMRPGKPVAFGEYRGVRLVGLPGNPASAFVGFEVFVRPAIQRLAGNTEYNRTQVTVKLGEPVDSDGRESYMRGIVSYQSDPPTARLTGHQGSGNLFSLVQANALLIIPSGVKSLPAGSEVEAWLLEV